MSTSTSYGVPYKPKTPIVTTFDDLLLQLDDIRYIRVQWADPANIVRYKVLSRSYFVKLLHSSRPSITMASPAWFSAGLAFVPDPDLMFNEWLYVFDPSSFRKCTYAPGHATIMGFLEHKTPSPSGGVTLDVCPRTMLKRIVDDAQTLAGVSFLAGFESEFMLLSATSPEPVFVNTAEWCYSRKIPAHSAEAAALEEIADKIVESGIELQMFHGEAGRGQYEIVTGPMSPLEAADALVYTRELTYSVAKKHGLHATFAPRVSAHDLCNGAHLNLSVHTTKPDEARAADAACAPTLTPTERSFLQALLTHLPAICALIMPVSASYERTREHMVAGGPYACWGTNSREAAVRLCGAPGDHRFEVRHPDAAANPYLVLAGVLGAGLQGVKQGALLTFADIQKPLAQMTEEEKNSRGIAVPTTIVDARKRFQEDSCVKEMFGDHFVNKYVAVNEILAQYVSAETEEASLARLAGVY
ncbi:uncharacterized protein FIBRA_08906 [Fibroporia radiculosa]|uniref:GS catalytic domain-containing protein n=1 Tax=Fibroporia radiculosa TaxID=599839 RepID=J4ICL6_9APHY|nr:uncharacterized protein FIBRA_08906 [Fibroporia radiculosa]CCM06626.1 predicted protein [Fibroporia radiculosa]